MAELNLEAERENYSAFKAWWTDRIADGDNSMHAEVFAYEIWQAARAATGAAQLDADNLPLPDYELVTITADMVGSQLAVYRDEQVRKFVAPYAERIRQMKDAFDAAVSLAGDTINARNAEVAEQAERIRHLERENGLLLLVVEQLKARLASADAFIESRT
jgi:hypothetical protein